MTHIMVWRGELPEDGLRGFWHHGIECDNDVIIHYSGMDGMKTMHNAQIMRTSMNEFLPLSDRADRIVHRVRYASPKYAPAEVVQRAESRIGERGYSLVGHNCENFARWCVVGRSKSYQVEGAAVGLGSGLATIVTGGGLLGAAITALAVQRVWDAARNRSHTRRDLNSDTDTDPDVDRPIGELLLADSSTQSSGSSDASSHT